MYAVKRKCAQLSEDVRTRFQDRYCMRSYPSIFSDRKGNNLLFAVFLFLPGLFSAGLSSIFLIMMVGALLIAGY